MSRVKVLDEGYVELIEKWGSDERIIESARMSTNKGFQGWETKHREDCHAKGLGDLAQMCGCPQGDTKLLTYLYEHKHMTPFEMCGMTIEVQAPIFVFREWHRHRTQSYNELSARYTALPDLFYVPSVARLMEAKQSRQNKQGSEGGFSESDALETRVTLEATYRDCRDAYERLLSKGVAREVARLVIPVAQYSRMRASANLRNWLAFLTLRMDEAAQFEIRQYANEVGKLIEANFPRTWELFNGNV